MTMRVTSASLMHQALEAMRRGQVALARTQGQIATGRRLQSPSDDPAGHAAAIRLQARVDATVQFARQARQAQSDLGAYDALLERVTQVLGRAQEIAVIGADASKGPAERQAMSLEVDHLLEDLVATTSARNDLRYLLGGQETLAPPLQVTRDPGGRITAATWNPAGVDGAIMLEVAEGVSVQTNIGGSSVLGADTDPTFAPQVLIDLRDALAASDGEAVRATLEPLATVARRLAGPRAAAGGRLALIERTLAALDTEESGARAALSAVLDADIGRLATELNQQEMVYQASLHAAARAIQPTLLEFLR